VQAITANSARGFDVEDTVAVILRFASGALGTFLLSDSVPSPYVWDVAAAQALYLAHQPGDCYFIGGESGTLAVPSMQVWSHAGDGDWRHPVARTHHGYLHQDCYRAQLDDFLAVVRGETRPLVDGTDGLMALATIEAIATAAREGREIAVASMLG
jgi:predicted dehydrogenase